MEIRNRLFKNWIGVRYFYKRKILLSFIIGLKVTFTDSISKEFNIIEKRNPYSRTNTGWYYISFYRDTCHNLFGLLSRSIHTWITSNPYNPNHYIHSAKFLRTIFKCFLLIIIIASLIGYLWSYSSRLNLLSWWPVAVDNKKSEQGL